MTVRRPAAALSRPARFALAALATVAGALVLYGGGLHGRYYGDDLFLVFAHPERLGLADFFRARAMHFLRPLDHAYVAQVQAAFGLETWPIHALALFYHVVLVGLTYALGRMLGLARRAAFVAAAFVLVHEVGPYGVAGVDTLSQVGGTAWGLAAMTALAAALRDRARVHRGYVALALAAFTVSLLYKETSASFLPLAVVLVLALRAPVRLRSSQAWRSSLPTLAAVLAPYVAIFAVYLMVRAHAVYVQPTFGETERYSLRFGLNIPTNLAQFAAALLTTGSTVQTYLDVQARSWGRLALVGAATVAFAAALLAGLWRARVARTVLLLAVMTVGALFPAALINRVSELYAYNALPFAALLVGIAGTALWARAGRTGRGVLVAGAAALVLVHGLAVRQKVAFMVARGEDAHRLLGTVVPAVRALPPGGRLVLRNAADAPRYSVFLLSGIETLRWGEPGIVRLARRPDVQVVSTDPAPVSAGPAPGAARTLVYERGRLVDAR